MRFNRIESFLQDEPTIESDLVNYARILRKQRAFNLALMISLPEVVMNKIRLYLNGEDYLGFAFLNGQEFKFKYYERLTNDSVYRLREKSKILSL